MGEILAVEQVGAGEPRVLIHGFATTRAVWTLVAPALSRGHRVVTLDVPGFGESEPAGPGFELDRVAERIAEGLAARGVATPFDLLGHSLGAAVALTLAARRPDAVRRLVLAAPAGLGRAAPTAGLARSAPADGAVRALADGAVRALADGVLRALADGVRVLPGGIDGLLAARRSLAPLTDLAWGRRLLLLTAVADAAALPPTQARLLVEASAGARRSSEALATIASADLRPLLARTEAPLGLIWGARDRTVPLRAARLIADARPDATLDVIQDAGHVSMVERPEAFVAAAERLLAKLR
jgi:pimeloyl-ACP methyl ester carboxylesterase